VYVFFLICFFFSHGVTVSIRLLDLKMHGANICFYLFFLLILISFSGYLPSWLVLFLLHSKVWDEDHDRDVLRDAVSDFIHSVRNEGRKICPHEQIVTDTTIEAGHGCPAVLSKKGSAAIHSAASSAMENGRHMQNETV